MKNNEIIFDNLETYPKKLLNYLETLDPQEKFPKINHEMIDYINSFNTHIYHCTKLIDKNDILNRGIKRIAFDQKLKDNYILLLKEITEDDFDFKKWINEYNYLLGRGKTIHATGPLNYIEKDINCLDFFEYFGGEILIEIIKKNLRKIIPDDDEYKNKVNEYKNSLKNIGVPYLVDILVPVKELSIIDYEAFFGNMCRFYKNYSSDLKQHFIPNIGKTYERDILISEIKNIFNVKIIEQTKIDSQGKYISIY